MDHLLLPLQNGSILRQAAALASLWLLAWGAVAWPQTSTLAPAGPTLVSEQKITEAVTQLTFSDGTVRLRVQGRPADKPPIQLLPALAPANSELPPSPRDRQRGYLVFVPADRRGVLPDYRPAAAEMRETTGIFASPGEFEPATFCVRPLRDLGQVKFEVGPFKTVAGQPLSHVEVDTYVVAPTIEQIGLDGNTCQWQAKWLQPVDTCPSTSQRNIQVYLDIRVPPAASAGTYKASLRVIPQNGQPSDLTLELEVLPLRLSRPMPWGFFCYNWSKLEGDDGVLWQLREMRRAGMTQCVISPLHCQNRPGVQKDGSVDFSLYDRCVQLYREAGFEDPPILAMEGLMFGICEALGKASQFKFDKDLEPGVKADEVPSDVRAFAERVVRRIYEHAVEAKWLPFYVYFADEPGNVYYVFYAETRGVEVRKMEKAKFMYGLARKVAPEIRTACTIYDPKAWESLDGLIDLNICHYIHPCKNADANRQWHQLADRQRTRLYGIDFIGPLDTLWEGRQLTLTAEKGYLAGMMCWIQSLEGWLEDDAFTPYWPIRSTWKGGPWVLRQKDGRVWRSLPWLGVREGIDDSRYLRTAKQWIERARRSGDPRHRAAAKAAEQRVATVMDRVPWVPAVRAANSPWSSDAADTVRRELAQVAIALQAQTAGQ